MIKFLIFFFLFLIFSGCSFKIPQNQWQFKSANAFSSYTKNFLSAKDNIAKNDLQRAIKHAKQSADLTQLSRIYLGKCALNISLGIEDSCQEYVAMSNLVDDKELKAYYALLTYNLTKEQIELLPDDYKDYAKFLLIKDFNGVKEEILTMNKVTSKLLATALIHKSIDNDFREKILHLVSFYGYKKVVLFYLNEIGKNTKDKRKRGKIEKKISILSKN